MTDENNIDDFLAANAATSATSATSATPEPKAVEKDPEPKADDDYSADYAEVGESGEPESEPDDDNEYGSDEEPSDDSEESKPEPDYDDYGNEVPPPKTYSEDEVNERINAAVRDRLARQEKSAQQQPESQPQAQQAEGGEQWQEELETFIDQTISKRDQKSQQMAAQQQEAREFAEFEAKFVSGARKFTDYDKVVGSLNIPNNMVNAARGLNQPGEFFYAAAKRAPEELDRIKKIANPYVQAAELGALNASLKKQKSSTKAPKPIRRGREDMSIPKKESKGSSIDDLLQQADQQRFAKRRGR